MAEKQLNKHGGNILISDDVVATIAGLAALETPGIAAMSGGLSDDWVKMLSGKNLQKGVSVKVGEVEAAIDLRVIVVYGMKIHEVCHQLQVNIRDAVQNMTGLSVVEIHVKVEEVSFKDEELKEIQRISK
ncbi:Asp23/Gls24 family envelope stress response protein [Paenibacillus alvei]|uniref:Asp23/Gls24 family envelope stress response protein n=1 Tax=Paenibacillus alvei TaxID=44250 RepID=A0ABT4GTL4_PAEAL|nr:MULTISPECIES: Asp23/Gls24 family envelope stress response protein [Paenibacillus]EJW17735.1 putative alkaline shock protein 23 [Paenibacillus alvei DSM 29]MCY7483172.1 Asp23/Gls24 family envelope stress response protein [Paenibacillus alvei]MCY9544646.1 Asp23/Gls24 family envelope stress response protein [Paenibacillus alvei]MCY9707266.1 Asp23/Gls24 family envelope stress response protein [Paenibacillus alvei]MCY9733691.1 Asp23/Gls24 family envelope stress response protein [Paenibacillus al